MSNTEGELKASHFPRSSKTYQHTKPDPVFYLEKIEPFPYKTTERMNFVIFLRAGLNDLLDAY